jgi:hypothetical protein
MISIKNERVNVEPNFNVTPTPKAEWQCKISRSNDTLDNNVDDFIY